MSLSLKLFGSCGPSLEIKHNGELLYQGVVDGKVQLDFPIVIIKGDVVEISGIGKRFGENGVWDTVVDEQGNIVSDKFLLFQDIAFNGISMGDLWIRTVNAESGSLGFYKNSGILITVYDDIFAWIITEKFMKFESEFSLDHTKLGGGRFDYEAIRNYITDIKQLLND